MKKTLQLCVLLVSMFVCAGVYAQTSTGTISGTVLDESGALVPNADVTITNKATNTSRTLKSDAAGAFSAPSLPVGEYEVKATLTGFRTTVRDAIVETGGTTTVDMRMQIGQSKDVVTVEAATAQIEYERHNIDGVITRQKIQELPLNGRSFLNLAFLEPGVTVGAGTTSQYNSLFNVSVLGGDSNKTNITIDGGNVRNPIEGNTGMNFSQEVVQEFQLTSANFDLATGITSVGSVNVVTRSGGNDFHGSAYWFFRDHNMSAYPALARSTLNPDPFFARRNPGFWLSGPIVKQRLFFFFNMETINQTQVFTFLPNVPSAASLTGNYPSPYKAKQISAKFDYVINANHRLFARYSHDGNNGFGPNGGAAPPSNWLRNVNWSDQSVLGVTSTVRQNIVNDFRFSYQYWHNRNLFPDNATCAGCIGLLGPQISINGTNVNIGNTSNATQGRDLRKFQFVDSVNWQKGRHGIKFGFDLEYDPGTGFWGYCDPACIVAASPEFVKGTLQAAGIPAAAIPLYFPTLPNTIKTYQDFLNLPFLGGVVGIGDPSQPPPYNQGTAKVNNRQHWYAQDTFKLRPRFTINYGLAWSFESTLVNKDLDRPKYLAPVYGSDLTATNNNYHNFSPALGFAWQADKSAKTVVRGGAGIYYDTELLWRRLEERGYLGPVGNGRVQYPAGGFANTFQGIIDFSLGGVPVPVGAAVPNGHLSNMTVGQFNSIVAAQGPAVTAALTPKNGNDLSVRNIDISKSAADLYPKDYPVQQGIHTSIGVQRQLRNDMVLSLDFVRRVYNHTLLGALDYNHYNRFINGVRSPVIPACTGNQSGIPGFPCSTGSITFWTPGGRQVYNALLTKLEKRFSHRFQFTASYALVNQHGYNGIINPDQWNSSWGPQGARHILNMSGTLDLPWGFQIGLISSNASKGPFTAFVPGVDLTGGGSSTPLPGLSINCINRGCGMDDIAKGVSNWNANYAGKKDALGKVMPQLVLPSNYSLGRPFNSQDIRVTKTFKFLPEPHQMRISVFGEVFNVLNYANLGYSGSTLDAVQPNQTYSFQQPNSRAGQVFGSGGPRAFQVGARFQF